MEDTTNTTPPSTAGEDAIGIRDVNFHFSLPLCWSMANNCPLKLAIYTTPSATAGEPTIGPPVLNVHFKPPKRTGPGEE